MPEIAEAKGRKCCGCTCDRCDYGHNSTDTEHTAACADRAWKEFEEDQVVQAVLADRKA